MPRVKVPVVKPVVVPVEAPVIAKAAPAPAPAPVDPPKVANAPVTNIPVANTPSFMSSNWQRIVVGGLFIVMLLVLLNVLHSRNQLASKVDKLSSSSQHSEKDKGAAELKAVTDAVGSVYQLPAGETPTIATVSDATKVRSQAFFKNADNGDKVLLYSKAGQAILYRPSTKKIISIAPVNLNSGAPSAPVGAQ